uniref:Uncharacterized protein n=1 Tax=Fagus sylvatica TaxID=28930 RepID=A0A2N9FKE2_FAGSY
MSGASSSSRHPRSVVQRESKSSAQKISSETSYKPSWCTKTSSKPSEEAIAGRASVVASSQYTDPNERSARRTDRWAASKELGSHNSALRNPRRSLNLSSTASRAEDIKIIDTPCNFQTAVGTGRHSRSRPPLSNGRGPRSKEHSSEKTVRPKGQHAVWKALDLVSSSPFSRQIEKAEFPERYTAPRFEIYNGRTNPVAYIGRYQQSMALSCFNDPLMCRLFPSSLGEVALRWFNQLGRRTINSWIQMAEAFVARFITNNRKTKEMDALLTMKLEDNETIKEYSTRIDQFIWVEEDGGGTTSVQAVSQPKVIPPKSSARSGSAAKSLSAPTNFVAPTFRAFETVFKEPIYKLMEKIKRELFFVWPPKLLGNPALRVGKLYSGHLNQYIDTNLSNKKEPGQTIRQPQPLGAASAGVIHVIHNPLCSTISPGSYRSEIQKTAHLRRSFSIIDSFHLAPICSVSEGAVEQTISFSDSDLKDVQLPHNDPLVITLRIGNYDVQRVFVDQGSFAEVMYQDLYSKLGLGEAELSSFTSPIFGFSGEPTMPLGKTILPVLVGPINLQTEFIVVKASSPYNAIMGHDWLHRMRAIPSILHQKLRFPTKDGVMELNGDQELEDGEVIMTEQTEKVFFDPSKPELFFLIGSKLSTMDREHLLQILMSNKDVFAWSVYNAPGVSPDLACHSLNIRPEHKPVVQKQRKLAPEKATIVLEETKHLLASRAIRERMVTKMFGHLIGKTVEVYIDDMLIKSLREEDHAADLLQVFDILRVSRLRLNAFKCTFGVNSGKFLGHMVSRRRIEANPDQIAALVDLAEPRNIKQVQRLMGMVAALGRFISRSANKCKPFFRLLGKWSKFVWDEECSVAFQGIKAYLSTPPCLSIPNPGEPLFLYLAVSDHAVSVVLVRELGQEQKPVFFVSKAMDKTELRYLPLEKTALTLLQVAKKLPHYFQSSTVTVLSDLPLKMLLQRSDFSGRITKWGYDPSNPSLLIPADTQLGLVVGRWELFVNGASNSKGSGAGVVLVSPEGLVLEQAVRLKFSASNNEAECEALLIGLKTSRKLGANHLQVFCDSQLVANQVSGEYQARDERMSAYLTAARSVLAEFESIHVAQIEREHNSHTDILAKLATALESNISQPSRMDPILSYLKDSKLPEDRKEANMIKRKAPKYWVSKEGLLYRRSFTGPYLLCIHPDMRGFDIVGPLPRAPKNKRFLITAIDYFTKWVDAEPLSNIRDVDAKRFLWKNVVTHFGIPWAVISDNGTQFESRTFKGFCSELGIKNFFSSPGYPQSNGQAEVSNKIILSGIKKKLEEAKGKWVEELPSILWTHMTTARKSTGETPFALAYGVEAVIPLEVDIPTTRTTDFNVETNENNLRKDLDLLEERRDLATVRLASFSATDEKRS